MKNLSRLTALLLALVMLLSITASAEEGIPQRELDADTYNTMLTEVQTYGLIDSAYQHYVDELAAMDVAQRYETLNRWHNGLLGPLFYARFIAYYTTTYPDGDLICTCATPAAHGATDHGLDCAWHFNNLSIAEQYELSKGMSDEEKANLSAETLDALSRVNATSYSTANVAISVPEGAFEEDYFLNVDPVTLTEEQLGLLFNNDASQVVSAFDISFVKLGDETTELQPAEGSPVSLDFSGLNDGLHVVYHLYETENGYEAEIVNLVDVSGGQISADAQAFSVYVVSDTGVTSNTGAITNDTLTVGETKTYYWSISNTSYTMNYCIWHIDDPDGIIDYQVTTSRGEYSSGYQYQAPWITVTALRAGTVTLTMDYVYTYYRNNRYQTSTGSETFTITINEQSGFHIENKVPESGCLVPAGLTVTEGVEYTWTRSDGQIVRADALNEDGSVNISKDRGGVTNSRSPITYTVTATITADDGTVTTLGTAEYEVLYGQEILNASFEKPVFSNNGNKYFYNGYPDLYWKTTAPGSGTTQLTQDIELIREGTGALSAYGVQYAADCDQFAELNAEAFGALYQDILTTPGATLTWSFSHAARTTEEPPSVNQMFVVLAATEDAQDIQSESDIDGLLDALAREVNNKNNLPSSGSGYKLTYNGEVFYIWYHDADKNDYTWENISGVYTVPDEQYLTRIFFATDTNATATNKTLGNLIDATSAKETMQYKIMYYVNGTLKETQTGNPEVYTYVQANSLSNYLDQYVLTGATVNGLSYPGDVAAEDFEGFYIAPYREDSNDDTYPIIFRLYFKEEAITVTKEVTISNWDELSSTKQLALMTGYEATFGLYKSTDLENPISTVTVPITYAEGQDLIAIGDFALDGVDLTEGSYVVKEISATELTGYAMSTTYSGDTFEITATDRTKNVDCVNAYEFKKGALTITKNVTDNSFPADGKSFTFTVKPLDGQDLTVWLANNTAYTAADTGFTFDLAVGATKTASVTLSGLPAGSYEVVETADERYDTTYLVGGTTTTGKATAAVTQNGEVAVTVTNTAKSATLTIKKTVEGTIENQSFIFSVSGPNYSGDVVITGAGEVTLVDLEPGTYTVTEDTGWSWEYTAADAEQSVTLAGGDSKTVEFTNTAKPDKWLSDESAVENTFKTVTETE